MKLAKYNNTLAMDYDYDGVMHGLNRVVLSKGRRFLVSDRETANKYVENYLKRKAAGEVIPENEQIAGVLSVGDAPLEAITDNKHQVDFTHLSLHGKTDLIRSSRFRSYKEQRPRTRAEEAQSEKQRRATVLWALMAAQSAFLDRPKGVYIIHCEHGLHRSPAYFYSILAALQARDVTFDDFKKAMPNEKGEMLNKGRLINTARSMLYKALGKPSGFTANDPDAYRPYPRIMRVGGDVAKEMFADVTPKMSPTRRCAVVCARMNRMFKEAQSPAGPS